MTNDEYKKLQTFHRNLVFDNIRIVIAELSIRALSHDLSKLEEPEASGFIQSLSKLSSITYGSREYLKALEEIQPSLDHHYKCNRHHPEHHFNGIRGMNLVDLIEMFCDWHAATNKHDDGNINESIDINCDKFAIDDDLKQIFINTIDILK